jgi:hypothetical protein
MDEPRALRSFRLRRMGVLVLLLAALTLSMGVLLPTRVEGIYCCTHSFVDQYYSDGTYRTVVGACSYDCYADPPTCRGQQTQWYRVVGIGCCPRCPF